MTVNGKKINQNNIFGQYILNIYCVYVQNSNIRRISSCAPIIRTNRVWVSLVVMPILDSIKFVAAFIVSFRNIQTVETHGMHMKWKKINRWVCRIRPMMMIFSFWFSEKIDESCERWNQLRFIRNATSKRQIGRVRKERTIEIRVSTTFLRDAKIKCNTSDQRIFLAWFLLERLATRLLKSQYIRYTFQCKNRAAQSQYTFLYIVYMQYISHSTSTYHLRSIQYSKYDQIGGHRKLYFLFLFCAAKVHWTGSLSVHAVSIYVLFLASVTHSSEIGHLHWPSHISLYTQLYTDNDDSVLHSTHSTS